MEAGDAIQAVESFQRAMISVQMTIADRFTPALRRTAISFEIFAARANGEWNRYQMVGWRRSDDPKVRG